MTRSDSNRRVRKGTFLALLLANRAVLAAPVLKRLRAAVAKPQQLRLEAKQ
jgi:hypothetical protein